MPNALDSLSPLNILELINNNPSRKEVEKLRCQYLKTPKFRSIVAKSHTEQKHTTFTDEASVEEILCFAFAKKNIQH